MLVEELTAKRVVVLCGAGISRGPPTRLPLGEGINERFRTLIEDTWLKSGLVAPGSWSWAFVEDLVPERVIGAFFSVFGYEVFRFMNSFLNRPPNVNHRALAELAASGNVRDIVTVNFDRGLEDAWNARFEKTRGSLVPCTSWSEFTNRAKATLREGNAAGPLPGLHKLHGSLPSAGGAVPEGTYRNIQFTTSRIGTEINPQLVEWLDAVLHGRTLFATGYSNNDLDLFPALTRVSSIRRVIWNYFRAADLSAPDQSHLVEWLRRIGAHTLPGALEDVWRDLPEQFHLDVAWCVPPCDVAEPDLDLGPQVRNEPAGVLLAAAVIARSANRPGQREVVGEILSYVDRSDSRAILRANVRKQVMAAHLLAGRLHDDGDLRLATYQYARAAAGIRRFARGRRRNGQPLEEIAVEITPEQAICRLAYQHLCILKRNPFSRRLPSAIRAWRLLRRMAIGDGVTEIAAQKLAAYFLGDLWHVYGLALDWTWRPNFLSKAFYRRAYRRYAFAVAPTTDWVPPQSFHGLRKDEAWLLMNRTLLRENRSRLEEPPYRDISAHIAHCEYIAGRMSGELGLTGVLLVRALEDAVRIEDVHQARRAAQEYLARAEAEYRSGGYDAGHQKLDIYRAICDVEAPVLLQLARVPKRLFSLLLRRLKA